MHVLKILSVLIVMATVSQAAVITWQGGSGNWTDANWTVDGVADQTVGTTISDQVTITNGSISVSGDLVAAIGGTLANQNLTVGGDAQLNISGIIDFGAGNSNTQTLGLRMEDSAQITASYLQLKTKNFARTDIVFAGGTLILTSDNMIRGGNFPSQNVDITAGVGEFSIQATTTPAAGKALSTKVGSDLFSLDGTEIVVAADGSSVSALNTELALNAVNGTWLQVTGTDSGPQTLHVIPEPATFSVFALEGMSILWIRRRVML